MGYYRFKFKGEDAVLCHGVGHLMSLVPASSYDEKFKNWDLSVFPCIPKKFKIAPKKETLACSKLVKSFFEQADWCINAAAPDREGELIFSYVYQACGCKAPYKRVWIEDLTDEKIRRAFNNLIEPKQPISAQNPGSPDDLQMAGRARDIADWLIGNNLTVAATKRFGGYKELLSVGRVQTPTLALVVEREKAILNHTKLKFWRLMSGFTTSNGETFEAEYIEGKITKLEEAEKKLVECGSADGIVAEVNTKHKSESAPLLFNATQLQIAANKKFGWDSDKTTKVMQDLYEHKLMTYPRTSSEHLTEAMMPEVASTIGKLLNMPEYSKFVIPKDKWQKFSKRHFDDKKVGSHPAIIPTVNVPKDMSSMSDDERKLYDLLAKSLIRIIYPKAELDDTAVFIDVNRCVSRRRAALSPITAQKGDLLCPVCGKVVKPTPFGWGCTGYSKDGDGCKFTINKTLAGVQMTDKNIAQLLNKGRTGLIKGFVSKSGKKFNAYLVIDSEIKEIKFDFLSDREREMVCPICGKPMKKSRYGYICSDFSRDGNGCDFSVNTEICKKKISEAQVAMLLKNGRTDVIKGFKSKAGKEFDASLVVNKETHKIDFEFAKQEPITPPRGGYYPDDAELEYYEPVIPEEMM